MSDFKTKMHQIRFRLGIRPRPRWGSLQRSQDPLAGFGALLLRGGGGEERGRGEGGKGRKGNGLKPPQSKFYGYVAVPIDVL